ncbi:MAG: aminotransferase class V-fold PLP-dependent enzyme [Planctomycetaceae bacterium]|nr:aminotransferase class V-fold PLP-dependent enzyme [Planctomycetaceae bacterium]
MQTLYLDNAATSFPKPVVVCDAVDTWMRQGSGAYGRTAGAAADAVGQMVDQTRHRLATLLDIPASSDIAFTFNCTDSLNLLLRGLLCPGERVVTTTLEHNSVLRPLHQLMQEQQLLVDFVDCDPLTGIVDPNDIRHALRQQPTRLVVITHASNVLGTVQPIRAIADEAHAAGALVLLDAAQTAGHFPFSMRELDVDFLATAGHKGLLGPTGTGLLAIRSGLAPQIRPMRCGGTGTASEQLLQPNEMPMRLESGNLNLPGLAGLHAAAGWLTQQTIARVSQHVELLTTRLREQLQQIPGVTCYPQQSGASCGIVSFNIHEADCREVATILDQSFHIVCRAGLHCAPLIHRQLGTVRSGGTVRLSPGPLNSIEQIDLATDAVTQIAAAF